MVATLDQGTLRFTDLHRQVPGISQRMLTLTLCNPERDGLITRTVHAEVPPRVEYTLTATGKSLVPPALALAGWAIKHAPGREACVRR
ncbi:winged helix-turn-helix transcriptional regulator [Actinoplanes sp. CA-252034]|uniref:winged helix-turn-helix transcriptional regulator n=1 Tax=Actinoplanes sp. CA-252034 TaxID=3239906 RepID=UPI003D992E2E